MVEAIGRMEDFLPSDMLEVVSAPFVPSARYYSPMDYIIYLEEDIAYRADRVDQFLTILWHPEENRAVGVKLKGFRFIFERMRDILSAQNVPLSTEAFPLLVTALEVALTATGLGASMMAAAQRKRLDERYSKARELLKSVRFDPSELLEAA